MANSARRPVLDEIKKREILAILTVGCGRRTAAQYVGCAPSTIGRAAQIDPKFATELRRAEKAAEVVLLHNVRRAASDPKYWRAAAWALERCHPGRYGTRRPGTMSIEQIRELLARFADIVAEEVPVRKFRKAVLKQFHKLTVQLRSPEAYDEGEPEEPEAQSELESESEDEQA